MQKISLRLWLPYIDHFGALAHLDATYQDVRRFRLQMPAVKHLSLRLSGLNGGLDDHDLSPKIRNYLYAFLDVPTVRMQLVEEDLFEDVPPNMVIVPGKHIGWDRKSMIF